MGSSFFKPLKKIFVKKIGLDLRIILFQAIRILFFFQLKIFGIIVDCVGVNGGTILTSIRFFHFPCPLAGNLWPAGFSKQKRLSPQTVKAF